MDTERFLSFQKQEGPCSQATYNPIVKMLSKYVFKKICIYLAGVAQWIERQPGNQRVSGLIPSQGTCLGCRPDPQWGVGERQPHTDVSLPLFLPPFPSV